MPDYLNRILIGQFEASLGMMSDCLSLCPTTHWDQPIAKYPFWQVAHHALCFGDLYLSPSKAAFEQDGMSLGPNGLHPKGWSEFDDEYPSRSFDQNELLAYTDRCRQKALTLVADETLESMESPCGFPWLRFSRGELHMYNIRHLQHHVGQLGAFLRRIHIPDRPNPKWIKTGWV